MVAILQLAQTQKAWFGMLDKFSLQIRQHVLLYNCKIAEIGKPLTSMPTTTCNNLQSHTSTHTDTHTPGASLEEVGYGNCFITTEWFLLLTMHISGISAHWRKKNTSYLMGFFFSWSPGTRRAVFPRTRAARPGRGGCVDSLSLLMEKAHNVSSVHRLTLEASQRRTKLSQSSCPPWVSGRSSGFIKLLRKRDTSGPSLM